MLLSLLVLGGAIALFRITHRLKDEVATIIGGLIGLLTLVVSLLLAPWIFKLILVVVLLALPTCLRYQTRPSITCPRLCIARGKCPTLKPHCWAWVRLGSAHAAQTSFRLRPPPNPPNSS